MLYYHGTNYEAGEEILRNGFRATDTIWSCSDSTKTYMVGFKEKEESVEFAIGAAQIAAAQKNSQSENLVIFEFDIPEDIAEENLFPDISCPNMEDCWCISNKELNRLIKSKKIKMSAKLVPKGYIPELRLLYFAGLNAKYIRFPGEHKHLIEIASGYLGTNDDIMAWFYDEIVAQNTDFESFPDFFAK